MDAEQEAAVKNAAQLFSNIHFAEKSLETLHTKLETALKGFTGEQATLYAQITESAEKHWQALAADKANNEPGS